jgi:hypothetical protein
MDATSLPEHPRDPIAADSDPKSGTRRRKPGRRRRKVRFGRNALEWSKALGPVLGPLLALLLAWWLARADQRPNHPTASPSLQGSRRSSETLGPEFEARDGREQGHF